MIRESRVIPRRREMAWLLLILAATITARFWALGSAGLWLDEAYTVNLVRGSLGEILRQLQTADDAPPLFYLLEKLVVSGFGESEAAARLLPALAGTVAVVLAWRIGREVSQRTGILCASVFAVSGLAVFYSQQARSYSLLHALSLLLLWASLRVMERPDRRRTGIFGITALLLLYTHNLALWIVLAALLAVMPALLRNRAARRTGLVLLAGLALGAVPWGLRLLGQLGGHQELNQWIASFWSRHPLVLAPVYSAIAFVNGSTTLLRHGTPIPTLPAAWTALGWPVLAAALGGLVALLFPRLRRSEVPDGRVPAARLAGLALLWTLVPCLGLMLISVVLTPGYIVGRTDTLALPGFLLLLGIGWSLWRPRWLAPAALGIWTLAGVLSLVPTWTGSSVLRKGSDRDLARRLASEIRPGDAVVFGPLTRPTFEYYGRRLGILDRLAWRGSYPPRLDTSPAAVFPAPFDSAAAYGAQALDLRELWETAAIERVWLLTLRPDGAAGAAGESKRGWPRLPAQPPPERRTPEADALAYPANLLVAYLVGAGRADAVWEYQQDWISGDRLVLRIDRSRWVPRDSIPKIEFRP